MRGMAPNADDHVGHRQRLRERFEKTGLRGFADHEVVELLLTLAIPRGDVKPAAKALLGRFGNLRGILDASPEDLRAVRGLGTVAPVALKIVREAAALYLQQSVENQESLSDPEALRRFWRLRIGGLPTEVFEVGYLNSSLRLVRDGIDRLEEGTIDRAAVYPRQVMEAAVRKSAAVAVQVA